MTSLVTPPLLTTQEVLSEFKKIPRDHFRENKYKCHRERWCAATILNRLSLDNYLVQTNAAQADSTDIMILDPASKKKHRMQVVEIAPRGSRAISSLSDKLITGYSSLKDEVLQLVISTVEDKEKKYGRADKKKLNLLIYLNPTVRRDANGVTWCIFLDEELDLDIPAIQTTLNRSNFGSIILLTSESAHFIKNAKFI